jgi:hypothetical protein
MLSLGLTCDQVKINFPVGLFYIFCLIKTSAIPNNGKTINIFKYWRNIFGNFWDILEQFSLESHPKS